LDLPNECIQNIFNFMPLKTLVKMGQTNRLTLEQVNYAIITKAKAFGCTQETIQASKEYLKTIFLELKTICDDYKSLNKYAVYKKHLLSKNTLDIEATFNKFITLNKSQNSLKETCANILFKAVEDQKLNSITTLIIAGTPIDLKNSKGDSALSLALLSKKDMKHEIELLLKHHADTNTLNLHKYSPLIIALRDQKDLSIVELLLKNGATKTINHFDEAGYSALHYAAKNGNLEVFNLLVNSGADIFIRKPNEPSIINVAISYSNIEVVKFLIKNRVNLSSIDEGGNTSLMYAVKAENLEVVQLLLDSGSLPTIDFQGTDRYTALHHAAEKENIELVKLLIDRGSNPRILNTAGLRASQMTTNIFIRELL
ncbi:MAG: ankyrin repeat domain-containing protein, partial [Parachlamydiales bacterium]|nr:ankyrin repeat domain-containing protein [Parachlamydiales bacterium]